MKILCVWCDQMAIGDTFERVNIMPALEQLGHEVMVFPLVNYNLNVDTLRPLDGELLNAMTLNNYDLMIFLLYKQTLSKETVAYIHNSMNLTTLMICGDDEKYYGLTKEYAPHVENIMTTFKTAVEWHKKDNPGINVIWAGYSANPKIYRKLNSKKTTEVSFYGARNDYRIGVLNHVVLNDIPVRVYGNGWRDDSIITTHECVVLTNETKVNINISIDMVNDKEIVQIKARDFEVPMCGGFLLTHANPLLSDFYKVGKEIETYKNMEELISKIKFYLKNDSVREKIARAGYERAKKDHKTVDRWKYILKNCVFKNGGGYGAR